MPKLTPPAPQNRLRRKQFFQEHPNWQGATAALERISIEQDKNHVPWWMKKKKPLLPSVTPPPEFKVTLIKEQRKSLFGRIAARFMPKKSQRGN